MQLSVQLRALMPGAALVFLCMIVTLACSSDEKGTGALAEGCHINTDCSSPLVCAFQNVTAPAPPRVTAPTACAASRAIVLFTFVSSSPS